MRNNMHELAPTFSLVLKNLLEKNMGDEQKLRLFSLSSYVWNDSLMNILEACLGEKRLE